MQFRVREVAQLVGRNESFVRQHIRRGHLRVERAGRSVRVAAGEARRWAKDRDLTLNEGLFATVTARRAGAIEQVHDQQRMARVRIIAVREAGQWKNFLTTIRCRYGSLETAFSTFDHELGKDVLIAGSDMSVADADRLVDDAIAGTVSVGSETICYSLSERREHLATRGEIGKSLRMEPLSSPFADASARVTEYWASAEPELEDETRHLLEGFIPWESTFGLSLSQRVDRVGNLVRFDAHDDVRVEVQSEGGAVRVTSRPRGAFEEGAYEASLDLYLDDDLVVSETFTLVPPTQLRAHMVDWDAYRLRVHRRSDGRCVDDVAHYMIREISTRMEIGGAALRVTGRGGRVVRTLRRRSPSAQSIVFPGGSQTIRSRQLVRRAFNREQAARKDGGLFRFNPGHEDAVRLRLRKIISDLILDGPVYIADPYFFGASNELIKDLLFDIYEVCGTSTVRILTAKVGDRPLSSDWPKEFRGNVSVRMVQRRRGDDLKAGFHDRFVASPKGEFLLTHSTTGWETQGVTIARLPYGVYYSQAEALWSCSSPKWKVDDLWP